MKLARRTRCLVIALATLPLVAQAHPGHSHETGSLAGALHHLGGLDHLPGIALAGLLVGSALLIATATRMATRKLTSAARRSRT